MKGLKKGVWTEEEDRKLLSYIKKNGEGGWRVLPQKAGLLRCGKSCRLRWANYLRPGIRRGEFSPEEEQIIIRLHASLGNRWATIARHLYRRTDNEIKNHWNTRLKKRIANTNITTDQEYSIVMGDPNYSANNTPTKSPSPTNYESDHISDDQLSHDRPESTHVLAETAETNLQYCPNNNANFDNCSTNLSHFDRPSHYGASSARLLNKIASKMGLINLRRALVVALDSSPSPTTDSSATSGGQINYNESLLGQPSVVSEVRGAQFMRREMSMEFESPVEELLAGQGSGCSYNSWRDFDDIGSVDTDIDDQVFFPK